MKFSNTLHWAYIYNGALSQISSFGHTLLSKITRKKQWFSNKVTDMGAGMLPYQTATIL